MSAAGRYRREFLHRNADCTNAVDMPFDALETLRFPSLLGALGPRSSPAEQDSNDTIPQATQSQRRRNPQPRPAAGAAPVVQRPSREGEIIGGKWKVLRRIGLGGTAEIYEAEHRNGRRGALKILRPELLNESDAVARFVREGRIANEIRHPGIVQALDDDSLPDGTPYLVLELLDGEGLDVRVEKAGGKLPPREVARIGIQLAAILAAVHRAGVIHRDIKPENLFIAADGTLRLLDFGIARFRDVRPKHRTYAGIAMGTPGYMPTEQAWGRWDQVDARTDVWAAGAVLYRILTGTYVQEGETMTRRLLVAMSEIPRRVAHTSPEAPTALAFVIDKALEVDPDRRFQSAGAMHDALVHALRAIEGVVEAREPEVVPAMKPEPVRPKEKLETLRHIPKRPIPYDVILVAVIGVIAIITAFPLVSWAVGETTLGQSPNDSAWDTRRPQTPAGLLRHGKVKESAPPKVAEPEVTPVDPPKVAPAAPTRATDRGRARNASDDQQKVFRNRR